MQSENLNIVSDWRIAHHIHMSVCAAVLNCTQVSEVLLDLQQKLPRVDTELLLRETKNKLKQLINAGVACPFITEDDRCRDLTTQEAMQELENAACWRPGGRYLATSKSRGSTYFDSIYENLMQYAIYGLPDA